MSEPRHFHEAVGRRVASLRREAGFRQDQLAIACQGVGLDWSRSVIAALETGRRKLNAGEIVLVIIALSRLLGRPVGLLDLLPERVEIRLSPRIVVDRETIAAWIAG